MSRREDRNRGPVWGVLCALVLVGCLATSSEAENKYATTDLSKGSRAYFTADPQAFVTADKMYPAAASRELEAKAEQFVAKVGAALKAEAALEGADAWEALRALGPSWRARQVQQAIPQWVDIVAARIRKAESPPASVLDAGNREYRAGRFENAAREYRAVLEKAPAALHVRNNLALAEMHTLNLVTAQVELEIIRKLDAAFVPAQVNLTVLLEQQGRRQEARDLADRTHTLHGEWPAAIYNAAWFTSLDGDPREAAEMLEAMSLEQNPMHLRLHELLVKQAGFWWRGVSARWFPVSAGPRHGLVWATYVGVLVLAGALLTLLWRGVDRAVMPPVDHNLRREKALPAAMLALASAWFLVYWGIPAGTAWMLFFANFLAVALVVRWKTAA